MKENLEMFDSRQNFLKSIAIGKKLNQVNRLDTLGQQTKNLILKITIIAINGL